MILPASHIAASSIAVVTAPPAEPADPGAPEPARAPTTLPRSASLSPAERVYPTWTDPTVRRASEAIGGPVGRHAVVGRAAFITPLRVCLLMAILVLICGWLYKAACIQQKPDGNGGYVLDQSGERPWITGCYNDVVPLYGSHGLDHQKSPYSTQYDAAGNPVAYAEYPVVTGYWMWGVSYLAKWYLQAAKALGLPVPLDVAAYFTINAILLGMLYLLAVFCTARMARRRIWDTAIMCLAPLLVIQAFTNWDLLAIGLTAAAMLAWALGRRRPDRSPWSLSALGWPIVSGLLIGVGTAAKLYPVLLLGALLVLCLRARRLPAWLAATGAAAVAWLAINLPVRAAYPVGWYQFIKMNTERPAEWNSWYSLYSTLSGKNPFSAPDGATPTLLNALSLGLFLLACAGIGWLALAVVRRPRFAQLAFLVVAAFLLTNKVWSPQYSLWLVPLAALALPRWRPLLAWQFSEAIVWILLMLTFDGDSHRNLSVYPFDAAAIVRDLLLLVVVVMVIREVVHPELDAVRLTGDDDPSGGVLDGAPDRPLLPSLPALWRRRPPESAADAADDIAADSGTVEQPMAAVGVSDPQVG